MRQPKKGKKLTSLSWHKLAKNSQIRIKINQKRIKKKKIVKRKKPDKINM